MELLHSGKVRDVWADGDDLLLVASDRISVFDVVLPTPVPDKGAVLTQLSLWWFERLADVVPHHVLSATDVPPQWAGRALRCRRLTMLPVECIARGYLAGSALADVRVDRRRKGFHCRPAWRRARRCRRRSSRPPRRRPRQRTARRTAAARRDRRAGRPGRRRRGGTPDAGGLPPRRRARRRARRPGGRHQARVRARRAGWRLLLGDELLTPDSSRFWPGESWRPGGSQPSFDKQYRARLDGGDRVGPARRRARSCRTTSSSGPASAMSTAYERITGRRWS